MKIWYNSPALYQLDIKSPFYFKQEKGDSAQIIFWVFNKSCTAFKFLPIEEKQIPSEMEVAPRYTMYTVYTVYNVYTGYPSNCYDYQSPFGAKNPAKQHYETARITWYLLWTGT